MKSYKMNTNIYLLSLIVVSLLLSCKTEPNKNPKEGLTKDITKEIAAEALPAPIAKVPYEVAVKNPTDIEAYPELQSFSFASHDNKWLMVGGRTNGFHLTSSESRTFPSKQANDKIWIIDHSSQEAKSAPLPESVRMHLRSTNMLYYQDGDWLYTLGGYGSNCRGDKANCYQTWPKLAALNVPAIIDKIWNAADGETPDLSEDILTVDDERMRITGGGLKKIGDYFYAVFGHNYDSIYKGGHTGKYTEEVRRFKIINDGKSLQIDDYTAYGDSTASGDESQYHRRDLGVVEAIRPDGSKGITAYGGVFSKGDGGWVNPIHIDEQTNGEAKVVIDTSLAQKFNQYECAHVLLFDPTTKTMYTTLLGGIGFYYFNADGEEVVSDRDTPPNIWLPFTKAINTIANRSDGTSIENTQQPPNTMPGLIGSNAIFVPAEGIATYEDHHHILDYSKLPAGETMVGYMYGGIKATGRMAGAANPTFANGTVYEVYVTK